MDSAIDKLSLISPIKSNRIFPRTSDVNQWMHHMDAKKILREKAKFELHKKYMNCIELILESTFHQTTVVLSLTSHLKKHPSKDMRDIAGVTRTNS